MSGLTLARFQQESVLHIVERLRDPMGSHRMLLADEVGLGKTVVARGVLQALMRGRRRPLTVIYLCSNVEIAEQNRTKLDPNSRKPIGRVTELAVDRIAPNADLSLYSFTPGPSLKDGTGLAWERRLLLYLLHRLYQFPVGTNRWREFLRCGAGEENWRRDTTPTSLAAEFERKTSIAFQGELAAAFKAVKYDGTPAIHSLQDMVSKFDSDDREQRIVRNRLIALLRGEMQRVALRHLKPDLVILDEVQRFRDVLDEANNPQHIAADLFSRRVPVLILSATPYRALTLAHEVAEGGASHHEDFFKTLEFLFDADLVTPSRIRKNLALFGNRLKNAAPEKQLDQELLRLKRELEVDLTKVICRTERNWYVLDRKKGVEDSSIDSGVMPAKAELEEFFLLHKALSTTATIGQVTEFWKSAPSLLTFLDSHYQVYRTIRDRAIRVPRDLLARPDQVNTLAGRNHRISKVIDLALGEDSQPPCLWTAPTYTYYQDNYFGAWRPRKVLAFSAWRFVPKVIAIVTSSVARARLGGELEDLSQPLRFTDKWSFHVFDVCYPSLFLAEIGQEAFVSVRSAEQPRAENVVSAARDILRERLVNAGIDIVSASRQRPWQAVMHMEQLLGRATGLIRAFHDCVEDQEEGAAEHLLRHAQLVEEWLSTKKSGLQLSELWLDRLALIAAFSPAVSVVRACQSVYGEGETEAALPTITKVCLGAMRRYFNRQHVQQAIRQHRFRMSWRQMPSEDKGYAERALIYSGDAHLQSVLDEYVYLLRHAGQAESVSKAVKQIGDVWTLASGNPHTNGVKGRGGHVLIDENSVIHATHFGLAFGEDVSKDVDLDGDKQKLRKSVVREAFNSPFWPFVLATTSVGQEGLDFHLYCRDVLHWNLPSNPVDLEQREGRINRRDCLAVRQSIAKDWPIKDLMCWLPNLADKRNPWVAVFDIIEGQDDLQKYKHGLFPHWVYECKDGKNTVGIERHVPFFSTSRDAYRYERLKTGLALYRLVFGQVNQEDLLDNLEQQTESLDMESKDAKLKQLSSYMLNLSPIGHKAALQHAREEAECLLQGDLSFAALRRLLEFVDRFVVERELELSEAKTEIEGLVDIVEQAIQSGDTRSARVLKVVQALAYLRNPYDHIFDQHVEGGLVDDVDVVRKAWAEINAN